MIKAIVFGASGIIGQHMMILKPYSINALFCKREFNRIGPFAECDITQYERVREMIKLVQPDVIINLAGENRVDTVERDPSAYYEVNVEAASNLALLCKQEGVYFIQVSTQGVFSGNNPPYSALDEPDPITEYGKQKAAAEALVKEYSNSVIARVTFVLGVRPFPNIGRENPLEQMFSQPTQMQENDRFFSVAFANDVADCLWDLCLYARDEKIVHIGESNRLTRFEIAASTFNLPYQRLPERVIQSVSYKDFGSKTHRPMDTTWAVGSRFLRDYNTNIQIAYHDWKRNEFRNKSE